MNATTSGANATGNEQQNGRDGAARGLDLTPPMVVREIQSNKSNHKFHIWTSAATTTTSGFSHDSDSSIIVH